MMAEEKRKSALGDTVPRSGRPGVGRSCPQCPRSSRPPAPARGLLHPPGAKSTRARGDPGLPRAEHTPPWEGTPNPGEAEQLNLT